MENILSYFQPLITLLEEEAQIKKSTILFECSCHLLRIHRALYENSYLKVSQALHDQSFSKLQDSLNSLFREEAVKREAAKKYLDSISLAVYQWIVLREQGSSSS